MIGRTGWLVLPVTFSLLRLKPPGDQPDRLAAPRGRGPFGTIVPPKQTDLGPAWRDAGPRSAACQGRREGRPVETGPASRRRPWRDGVGNSFLSRAGAFSPRRISGAEAPGGNRGRRKNLFEGPRPIFHPGGRPTFQPRGRPIFLPEKSAAWSA